MPAPAPASGALPAPRHDSGPYAICMVCLGNICRSPMAEAILRNELSRAGLAPAVTVDSAGTGDWHVGGRVHGPVGAELFRRGYDASAHRARQIKASWLARYDLVVAMDRANLAALRAMAPDAGTAARIRLLRSFDPALARDDPYSGDVPDPYGAPDDVPRTFDLIQPAVAGLAGLLARALPVDRSHPGSHR